MYITYCRNQRTLDVVDTTRSRLEATSGEFRPTYLIRVSDWEKVAGVDVKSNYCALSYCWAQSGEVVQKEDGEYDCIDNGKHCIIEEYDMEKGDSVTLTPTSQESKEFVTRFTPSNRSMARIKRVTYNQLLQQICKDFQIEYLWYDKICIDQTNKEIKQREIKQMHRIYSNACYTLAIVPEVHVYDPKDFSIIDSEYYDTQANVKAWDDVLIKSLWWKRSWTLEEIMTSKRILVCGTDTNLWQHSFHSCENPTTPDHLSIWMLDFASQQQGGGSINQALSEAHFRTSSKEHDKIFSLANIFHKEFKKMEINYKIGVEATFKHFYRTIATIDLSILCFASNLEIDGSESNENTMKKHCLPSWTGISGGHLYHRVNAAVTLLQSQHFICDNMFLHIPTKYYKVLSVIPYDYGCFSPLLANDKSRFEELSSTVRKRQEAMGSGLAVEEDTALIDWFILMGNVSRNYATHYYWPKNASFTQIRPLSLTEECDECVVLPILLKSYYLYHNNVKDSAPSLMVPNGHTHFYYLPVVKKYKDATDITEERYKSIGIYFLADSTYGDIKSNNSADEILHKIFKDDSNHHEVKEYIIE